MGRISNVKVIASCHGNTSSGHHWTSVFLLFVLSVSPVLLQTSEPGDPQITSPTTNVVTENTLVTFTCQSVGGNPSPSVVWYRNDTLVDAQYSTSSIAGTQITANTYTKNMLFTDMNVPFTCKVNNSATSTVKEKSWVFTRIIVTPSQPVLSGSMNLTAGVNSQFNCSVSRYYPASLINWKLGSVSIFNGFTSFPGRNADDTYTRYSILNYKPLLDDNGKLLRCEFTSNNVIYFEEKQVSVVAPPPFVHVATTLYTRTSGNVTLQCNVTGATSITWYKNGAILDTTTSYYSGGTVSNPSLIINSVSNADSGNYICSGTSSGGSMNSTKIQFIFGGIPSVVLSASSFGFLLGTQAKLGCRVSGSPAVTGVFWQKVSASGSGITLQGTRYSSTTKDDPDLKISNIAESDAGNYRCHAVNSVGEGKSALGSLVIHYEPRNTRITQTSPVVVVENNAFTLTCESTSSPGATYVWRRGNVDVGSTASHVINSADRGHAGTYTCEAKNQYGSETATIVVDVRFRPVSQVDNPSVITSLGATPTLSCRTLSNPGVTSYEWRKNGNVITGQTSKNYTFTINSASDYGTYSCYATNAIGTSDPISYAVQSISTTVSGVTPGVGASVIDTGLTSGEIAAIILSILFLLILLLLIIYCCISHGICACCRKEKQKGTVAPSPEKPKQIIRTIEIPRYVEKPYIEKPYYYSREPSSSAVSRQDVFIQEENFEISRYQMVPPAGTAIDGGTIISLQNDGRTPRTHHLPALDYNHINEEEGQKRKRRRKKKRRHHRERSEKYHSPRKDGEEVILANTNHYEEPDDIEVHAGRTYFN